jgi:hypothetical protein
VLADSVNPRNGLKLDRGVDEWLAQENMGRVNQGQTG